MNEGGWIEVSKINPPPEELCAVMDEFGNEAYAMPTIYPFKVIAHPPYRKFSSRIEPCEPYWDGGWLISCGFHLTSNIKGKIIYWKKLNSEQNVKECDTTKV